MNFASKNIRRDVNILKGKIRPLEERIKVNRKLPSYDSFKRSTNFMGVQDRKKKRFQLFREK